MKNLVTYSNYVVIQLNKVPEVDVELAAYDTGSGLTIAAEQGPRLSAIDTVVSRLIHIDTPRSVVGATGDEWDECWNAAKIIVDNFLEKRNK